MNMKKMQNVLDWMSYADPNGDWDFVDDYYLADCGLTWEDVPDIIRDALNQWREDGLGETAYHTLLNKLEEAMK